MDEKLGKLLQEILDTNEEKNRQIDKLKCELEDMGTAAMVFKNERDTTEKELATLRQEVAKTKDSITKIVKELELEG